MAAHQHGEGQGAEQEAESLGETSAEESQTNIESSDSSPNSTGQHPDEVDLQNEWGYLQLDSNLRNLLFTYITFPGIVLHELGHYLGAKLAGLKVVRVGWWTPHRWPTVGFVSHTLPKPGSNVGFNLLFIALAPAILPNLVGAWLVLEAARANVGLTMGIADPFSILLAYWIGLSAIFHGIPSRVDFRIAGTGIEKLRMELGKAQAQHKLARLFEYTVASALYGTLWIQQRLFNSFYGRVLWLALVGSIAVSLGPYYT